MVASSMDGSSKSRGGIRICKKLNIIRQSCIETPARASQTLGQSQITASCKGVVVEGGKCVETYQSVAMLPSTVQLSTSAQLCCSSSSSLVTTK